MYKEHNLTCYFWDPFKTIQQRATHDHILWVNFVIRSLSRKPATHGPTMSALVSRQLTMSADNVIRYLSVTSSLSLRDILICVSFLPARRYASAGLSDSDVSVCPSVRPSVCHTPVLCESRIVKCTPSDRPITLVSGQVWLEEKFARGHPHKWCQIRGFGFFRRFSTNMSSYLENGAF